MLLSVWQNSLVYFGLANSKESFFSFFLTGIPFSSQLLSILPLVCAPSSPAPLFSRGLVKRREGRALVLRLSPLSLMTQHPSTLGRGERSSGREGELPEVGGGGGSRASAAKRPGDDAANEPGSTVSVQLVVFFHPSEINGEQVSRSPLALCRRNGAASGPSSPPCFSLTSSCKCPGFQFRRH